MENQRFIKLTTKKRKEKMRAIVKHRGKYCPTNSQLNSIASNYSKQFRITSESLKFCLTGLSSRKNKENSDESLE